MTLKPQQGEEWGWRIAFLFTVGAFTALVVVLVALFALMIFGRESAWTWGVPAIALAACYMITGACCWLMCIDDKHDPRFWRFTLVWLPGLLSRRVADWVGEDK